MTKDKIKEGDICTLDESVAYSYNCHKPYEVVVLWHGVNSQPLVTKLDEYKPFWTTYSQLIEVKRHIDLSIKSLEQQTCEDAVSRQAVEDAIANMNVNGESLGYAVAYDILCDLPSVNPKHTEAEIQKMQELEQAEIQRAYELGKAEQQTCEDCKYNTKPRHAVCNSCICGDRYVKDDESKQQTCEDAVSREAALDAMYALCDTGETLNENPWRDNPHIDEVVETIEQLPSVNPRPKVGQWIYTGDYLTEGMLKCSECGEEIDVSESYYNFCPACGAKMVEP